MIEASAPGDVVGGRYRLDRELATGGMGAVFAATNLDDRARVVVKTMLPRWVDKPGARARFAREAEAAMALVHPGVVRVIEYAADRAVPYIVMELVEGQTLSSLIRDAGQTGMPTTRAVNLIQEVLAVLVVAHGRGIVHRDLKPANIMVINASGAEKVKVLDFGIARILDEERRTQLTKTGQILGTPGFLAPEQATGDAVDARTDLWAVGVILQLMLTGRLPFEGRSTAERIVAMLTKPPAPLRAQRPDLPEPLYAIVARALEKNPDDRFPTALALSSALASSHPTTTRKSERVMQHPVDRVLPPTPSPMATARPAQKKRRPIAWIAAAAVSAAAATAVYLAATTSSSTSPTLDPPIVAVTPTEVPVPTVTEPPELVDTPDAEDVDDAPRLETAAASPSRRRGVERRDRPADEPTATAGAATPSSGSEARGESGSGRIIVPPAPGPTADLSAHAGAAPNRPIDTPTSVTPAASRDRAGPPTSTSLPAPTPARPTLRVSGIRVTRGRIMPSHARDWVERSIGRFERCFASVEPSRDSYDVVVATNQLGDVVSLRAPRLSISAEPCMRRGMSSSFFADTTVEFSLTYR